MTEPIRVAAVVLRDAEGRTLLVRKRGTTVFMQPGGKPEPGETSVQVAAREVAEEIGLRLDPCDLTPLGVLTAPAANEAGRLVEAAVFAAVRPIRPEVVVIAAEIEEARWFRPEELVDPALADMIAPLTRRLPAPPF